MDMMANGSDPDERFTSDHFDPWRADGRADQGEILFSLPRERRQRLAPLTIDIDLDKWMRSRETRHQFRQHGIGIIVRHAEANDAAELRPRKSDDRFVIEPYDAASEIKKPLAIGCQLALTTILGEKRALDDFLKPLHLHAHRTLSLVHLLGGAGEAARFRDGDESLEKIDVQIGVHRSHPLLFLMHSIKYIRWTNQ